MPETVRARVNLSHNEPNNIIFIDRICCPNEDIQITGVDGDASDKIYASKVTGNRRFREGAINTISQH